jgi:hypothetical protein
MADETPATIAEGDLRRLYAKLNAHECLIRVLIHMLVDSAENPSELFESLRSVTMEEGDSLVRTRGNPNVEFIEQGRIDTLTFIAETFAAVKEGRDDSVD